MSLKQLRKLFRILAGCVLIVLGVLQLRTDDIRYALLTPALSIYILGEIRHPKIHVEEFCCAVLFAFFVTFGNVEAWDLASASAVFDTASFRYLFLSFTGGVFLFRSIAALLFDLLDHIHVAGHSKKPNKWLFLLGFTIVGFLLWLPYLLAYYPAIVNADGWWQIEQANGHLPLNNWLSVFHTLILRLTYSFGFSLFHDANAALATYSVFSMLVMSFSFSSVLYIAGKNGVGKKGILLLALFYYLCPFNALYAVTVWKDSFFGAALMLFSALLFDALKNGWSVKNTIFLSCTGFLICVLRSNGLYAFTACIPFLLIFLKNDRLKVLILASCVLICTFLFNGPVQNNLDVIQNGIMESLSVPIQQIGYTAAHNGTFTPENRKELSKIASPEEFANSYVTYISDDLKDLVRAGDPAGDIDAHPKKYMDLWLSIGKDNPVYYLKGFALLTRGTWFFANDYYWKYLDNISTPREPSDKYFSEPKLSEGQCSLISSWSSFFDHKIYSKFWSISLSNWACILLLMYEIKKRRTTALAVLPGIFVIGTLMIATPVSQEFRYSYGIFLSLPILLTLISSENTVKRCNTNHKVCISIASILMMLLILILNGSPTIAKERYTYNLVVFDPEENQTRYQGRTDATTIDEILDQRSNLSDFSYVVESTPEGKTLTVVNGIPLKDHVHWTVQIDWATIYYDLNEVVLPDEPYVTIWIQYMYE